MDTNPLVENIGYIGSLLTSITFIPQVYKSWKSKSVGDLSIAMIVIVISSTIVWLIYGYLISFILGSGCGDEFWLLVVKSNGFKFKYR